MARRRIVTIQDALAYLNEDGCTPLNAIRVVQLSRLPSTWRYVMITLMSHISTDGTVWCSTPRIMLESGLGDRSVRGSLGRARDVELLRWLAWHRRDGKDIPVYQVRLAALVTPAALAGVWDPTPARDAGEEARKACKRCRGMGCTRCRGTPAPSAGEGLHEVQPRGSERGSERKPHPLLDCPQRTERWADLVLEQLVAHEVGRAADAVYFMPSMDLGTYIAEGLAELQAQWRPTTSLQFDAISGIIRHFDPAAKVRKAYLAPVLAEVQERVGALRPSHIVMKLPDQAVAK